MTGTLFLLGIGPGDPELVTLKSARILTEVDVVAFPQKPGTRSLAFEIAKEHVAVNAQLMPLDIPMEKQRQPAQDAYDNISNEFSTLLNHGLSVAYLCEGDPFFYGSAMYLFSRLALAHDVQVVPGVASINAAAAAIPRPLVARAEILKILPATLDDKTFFDELQNAQSVAILKTGSHLSRVRHLLEQTGFASSAYIVEHASCANQSVRKLSDCSDSKLPYFSIILGYKGNEPWGNGVPDNA